MTDAATATATPRRIGGRYDVHGVLGRGGMAAAYHVTDVVTGREMALKQLLLPENERRSGSEALFEREFHTLAQLCGSERASSSSFTCMVLKNDSPKGTARGIGACSTNGLRSDHNFVSDREDAMSSSA